MSELLRALLAQRSVQLTIALIVLGLGVWFVSAGLIRAGAADECANRLVEAVQAHDQAFIEATVRNPSLQKKLLNAGPTELGFVRPMSTEWTRVGLFVKTATATQNVVLQLQVEDDGCVFLRDY